MTTQAPARGTGRHLDFANAQGQRFRLQVEDDPVDACAFTVRVIPGRLYISRSTVKTHLQSIYAKAGVPNRTALVALLHAVA